MKTALIIGGGFAGLTAANLIKQRGYKVTIVEKTGIIGGGVRTFFYHGHPYTYGPHHLLIDNDKHYILEYYKKYVDFYELDHYNMTYVGKDDAFYSFPIHVDDISRMPDRQVIESELAVTSDQLSDHSNFDSYWKGLVGPTLYEKFINGYSKKMWGVKHNGVIDEVTFSFKNNKKDNLKTGSHKCFDGKKRVFYPVHTDGYNRYFDICAEGTELILNADVRSDDIVSKKIWVNGKVLQPDVIVSTISPDSLFDYQFGELPYMGRDFLKVILPIEHLTPEPYHFIHYANDEPFTRIFEYKRLTRHKSPNTLIGIEFPSRANKLYPYPIKAEISRAQRYLNLLPDGVYSIGRAGKYFYDNQDMIIKDCIELFSNI